MQSSNTISCCLHHVQLCWRDAQILFVKYQKTFGVRCKDDGIAHANAYQLTELIHVFCFQEKHEAHNTCAHYSITENSKKVETLLKDFLQKYIYKFSLSYKQNFPRFWWTNYLQQSVWRCSQNSSTEEKEGINSSWRISFKRNIYKFSLS